MATEMAMNKSIDRDKLLPQPDAWRILKDLLLIVSRYAFLCNFPSPSDNADRLSDRLNRHNEFLTGVFQRMCRFQKEQALHNRKIIASGAHSQLTAIYEEVVSEQLSVEDSVAEIISLIRKNFGAVLKPNDEYLGEDRIRRYLVKAKDQITIRIPKNPKSGNISVTGPSSIASQALGEFIGSNYRATHDFRRGADLKIIFLDSEDVTDPIPEATDAPYAEIAVMLRESFNISENKIKKALAALGLGI
jgi:hypothetical protein